MNQDESHFQKEFGTVLRDLGRDRNACPDNERLIAWQAGELDSDQSEKISAHVKDCPECGALTAKLAREPQPVDDVTWARAKRSLDARSWPWQSRRAWKPHRLVMIAAGIAALAVALVWMQPSAPPQIDPTTRGAVPLAVQEPLGEVRQLEFRWQAMPIHHAYVVEIAGEDRQITSIETFRPPLQADAELLGQLETDTPYRWRVRAVDASGRTLAESAWTEFQLRD